MVIIRLTGGIGNQLFMYFAAYRLAKRLKVNIIVDDITGFAKDKKYERRFSLNELGFSLNTFSDHKILILPLIILRIVLKIINKMLPARRKIFLKDKGNGLTELDNFSLCAPIKLCFLEGYWQYKELYEDAKTSEISLLFNLKENSYYCYIYKEIISNISVSLHIRYFEKSDNVKLKVKDMLQYYENAIKYIKKKVKNPKFFIFSDMPTLAVNITFLKNLNCLIINNKELPSDTIEFFLMTKCSHHITANSTFSWWGATLSNHGIVCSPKKNIISGAGKWDSKLLIPEIWKKIL